MVDLLPVKPATLDPYALQLLQSLQHVPAAVHVVLGGYFALKHYCDYRLTHDVDAWWSSESTDADRNEVRAEVTHILRKIAAAEQLSFNRRRFGDTESWELARDKAKVFSFQIASRTVQLFSYLPSPWPPLRIESLAENLGSKMNALVQRGAPRDFVDVRRLIASGLATPADCWKLWQEKNPDLRIADAQAEARRHLAEIVRRRPLEMIAEPKERAEAEQTRAWFERNFFAEPN